VDELWNKLIDFVTGDGARSGIRALVVLVVGLVVVVLLRRSLRSAKRLHPQHLFMLRRGLSYLVAIIAVAWALRELGFELGTLLGAAGLLTVALGFAAQTSVSNVISGLFLIGERPFGVGDIITVGDTTGEVLSVDLLSAKLRTFDNLMVRIPNETMLKSNVTNLTHFPIRRADLKIGVAYKEDIGRVREILMEVADKNPNCLEEPRPLFIFLGYGDSSLEMQFSVWARKELWLDLRNAMYEDVKKAFDEHGVEIPFPHVSLYTGSVTEPFPVRMVDQSTAAPVADRSEER
jgi:small-conductance mechanosensitive channel